VMALIAATLAIALRYTRSPGRELIAVPAPGRVRL
jgi:hypothetical protein